MTTFAFPSVTPNSSEWSYISNDKTFASPLSGSVQTASRSGSRWKITLNFINLTAANRHTMRGFLASLNGKTHRFTVHDHSIALRGTVAGTPLVNGASQTGNTIITDGWTSGDNLTNGDMIGLDGELKIVTADISETAGAMTISFQPEIHTSPANNSSVVTTNPTGIFMLLPDAVSWSNVPGQDNFSSLSIEAIEDILA